MEMTQTPLVENERAFLASLDMKEGPYGKRGGGQAIGDAAFTVAGGAAGGAGAYAGWVATFTVWEKVLFALGVASPPVGIILGAATACGVGALACRKLTRSAKQKNDQALYYKVPKSIRCDPEELARDMVEVAVAFAEQEGGGPGSDGIVDRALCGKWGLDRAGIREAASSCLGKDHAAAWQNMWKLCRESGLDAEAIALGLLSDVRDALNESGPGGLK